MISSGARVSIAPLLLEHAGALQRFLSDRRVAMPLGLTCPFPPEGAEAYVRQRIEAEASGAAYTFVILNDAEVVGSASVHSLSTDRSTAEIAFWIAVPEQGRGFARAGVTALLEFAFMRLGLRAVVAVCMADNRPAAGLLRALGFDLMGIEWRRPLNGADVVPLRWFRVEHRLRVSIGTDCPIIE